MRQDDRDPKRLHAGPEFTLARTRGVG
jgi:hypothetical protein